MDVTIEDIRNGIAANPELKTLILTDFDTELPDYLKGKGFKVHTDAEYETEFGKRLNPKVAELYGNVEKDVLESLGIYGLKKESNTEKVYDLIKKAPALINAKLKEVQDKLDAATTGKVDDVTKAQIEAFKTEIEVLKKEKGELSDSFTKKELGYKLNSDFAKGFSELELVIPATVAEKDRPDYIAGKMHLFESALAAKYGVKEENGALVFTDAEGKVQMNGTNVATVKDLLAADFKYDFIPVKKEGSGSKKGEANGVPVVVQTKEQLYAQLAKEGLLLGSKEFIARANELASKNGIKLA